MMRFILPSVLFLEAHAAGCREKLGNFDVSFPEWQAVLANESATVPTWDDQTSAFVNTTQFTAADVPPVLGLIYGFWGGLYSPAGFDASTFPQITDEEKKTQSYVTLFPNDASCDATNCQAVAQSYAANNVTVLPLAGQSYALGACTKFLFSGNPLAIVISQDPSTGNCKLGVYTGHSCDPTGTAAETPKNQPSGTCDDFPLNQGFKMKVHCASADDTPLTFKTPQTSFLQKLMHEGTCRDANYTEYPCTMPASDSDSDSDSDSGNATSGSLAVVGASSVLALLALF